MHVAALWRYPVKSLGGEPLQRATLTADGVAGDRVVHVRGTRGPLTGRTRPGLLTLPVITAPDGTPLVDGRRWDTEAAANLVRERAGADAELAAYDGSERFDVANLLVATDGELAALAADHGTAVDVRRFRPNLVLGDVPHGANDAWPGAALAVGDALIGVHSPRQRCVVISVDPTTGARDLDLFRRVRRRFDNEIALNCWVIRPGTIRVGDTATLVPTDARPAHLGGWIVGAPYTVGRGGWHRPSPASGHGRPGGPGVGPHDPEQERPA